MKKLTLSCPCSTLGNVYLNSWQIHKLRVAIMSYDLKNKYENSNVEKEKKWSREVTQSTFSIEWKKKNDNKKKKKWKKKSWSKRSKSHFHKDKGECNDKDRKK